MVSKVKLTLLSVAIAIIFALFVGYGVSTFYEAPAREDYCNQTAENLDTKEECEAAGGKWNPSKVPKPAAAQLECNKISGNESNMTLNCRSLERETTGWCDADFQCRNDYKEAKNNYNRNVFIITLLIGLVGLVGGGVILSAESVGTGLMGGSLLTILYGVVRYWGEAPDVLRFSILGIVLGVLIWLGYKKFSS